MFSIKISEKNRNRILFAVIMLIGCLVRFVQLGSYPGGINQDEAFAGYEAYSLLHYGMDSSGNPFPVYFNSWGSGMNVLNSYLMIPFVAVFGLHTWVIRLPQCIVACFSLWVFYLLLKRMVNENTALVGLFYLALCPWHIMLSRWGLESNLAPGFLLFGLYFFLRGVDESKFYMLSALFYGLSLYCYATIWPVVPFILLLQLIYLIYTGKIFRKKSLNNQSLSSENSCQKPEKNNPEMLIIIYSLLILIVLALPLVLFLLVNKGYIDEIRLPFLTIPRLTYMRESEISLQNIPENFCNMVRILCRQDDYHYWNTTGEFGLYYKGGLLLAVIGFLYCMIRCIRSLGSRKYDPLTLALPTFFGGVILGCLIYVNVNRMNIIHLPIVLFAGIGLWLILDLTTEKFKKSVQVAAVMYLTVFLCFLHFYFGDYQETISGMFQAGLGEAVEEAMIIAEEPNTRTIYVDKRFYYSKILFYSKEPANRYIETVEYTNYPSACLDVRRFGNFQFGYDYLDYEGIYIISKDDAAWYAEQGFEVITYQNVSVASML